MKTRMPLALALSAALTLALSCPASAAGDVLAPGLTVSTTVTGEGTGHNSWTVTTQVPGGSSPDPDAPPSALGTREHADALVTSLRAKGFAARAEEVDWPAFADTPRGPLGWRVRVGSFADRAQAAATASAMTAHGFTGTVEWTGQDGPEAQGPQRVRVAVVDPRRFTGRVVASHGDSVAGRRTTSALAAAAGALVGTNGGFFVIDPKDGIPGEPAGAGVYQGLLQSEATSSRPALLLGERASIGVPRTVVTVGGREVNGVNRKPGIIRNCGEPGDVPTDRPRHDTTCTHPDELVLFTPQLGTTTPAGDGVEAVLDARDVVTAVRPAGGEVPAGGHTVQGVGAAAAWLTEHARPGRKLAVSTRLFDGFRPVHPAGVVNGGPWLVRDGRVAVDAAADGIVHPGDPSFVYGWGVKRNPRTMVGLDRRGRLLIVTADGRQPGFSEGLSLLEGAQLMARLGAVTAINLDGGGSTAMAIGGKLVSSPSDATGERPVGDAVLVVPR
ncbi:phosphodiester glycosidase family protein [Amycolatopsis australiensis]|uniref:phosphodiester glycosidase family protein n=1 Tax=Amycolatopsis australiensis TaxID=546364 RepID=UPI0011610EBA|nr:phosphodiester glycosidase family protein [Amycolatopsis australiensis]